MARMTEEEARALNDHFTNNEYTLGPNGSDWLSQHERRAKEHRKPPRRVHSDMFCGGCLQPYPERGGGGLQASDRGC